MIGPEIRAGMVQEIDNRAGMLQFAGEPTVADCVVDGAEFTNTPALLRL